MSKNEVIKRVESAIKELKQGHLVVVADSVDREGEGDMIGLADFVTPQSVNLMISQAKGLLCAPMSQQVAQRLSLEPMVSHGTDAFGTAFTITVDAKTTSTGISAYDRADTIKTLADPESNWERFYHPGHIFPLIAKEGGVKVRGGHTEAAVDLAKLAGATPVAYICEIVKDNGKMARTKDLQLLAEQNELQFLTISDILNYREYQDNLDIKPYSTVDLPTAYGHFKLQAFGDGIKEPSLLISKGDITGEEPLLVRVHSECLTSDALGSLRCDCGPQLQESLRRIEKQGRGAVVYLRQEGRGIGLTNKLRAYHLQDQGLDTVEANHVLGLPADARRYDLAAKILKSKGVRQVKLMTNNPDKIDQLQESGIEVVERIPLEVGLTKENQTYLKTKKEKFHHILNEVN
ncbi:GTP cyclohydrolase II [Companilactobacillus tucceti DSM 20183]|uniref:Multifunctional fusion protein n=1 Tax=Companilactobacillus tucceti DSM 20183 TaxID=1423811 RepID=A0A0R1J2H2_9LACO|nr:bifunctional 3,4-dihydroxy-2-butanone-4-phosphate synthase/GTP cyclohydrolase II [Companilactobacillus tucceti]KRK65375.1 GTP cyclohydrolase II [Companilactobacillus tucceti DSM 20183]